VEGNRRMVPRGQNGAAKRSWFCRRWLWHPIACEPDQPPRSGSERTSRSRQHDGSVGPLRSTSRPRFHAGVSAPFQRNGANYPVVLRSRKHTRGRRHPASVWKKVEALALLGREVNRSQVGIEACIGSACPASCMIPTAVGPLDTTAEGREPLDALP
jgi:hypothetical protein